MAQKMVDSRMAVIRAILMAQDSSDAGKRFLRPGTVFYPGFENARRMKYRIKPEIIRRALRIIDSNPPMGIWYWCDIVPDQNGRDSVLVYFEITEDGRRFQISFHNPLWKAKVLLPWVGKGRATHWNGLLGGSREACDYLNAKYFSEEVRNDAVV